MAIHHADNWQKKPVRPEYSDVLRDQRRTQVREDSKQAAKTVQNLHATKVAGGVEKLRVPTADVQQTTAPGKDLPQVVQRARGEVQAEAVRHDTRASQQFLESKKSAADLRQLETKLPSAKGDANATRTAVTEKGRAVETHIARQTAGQQIPDPTRAPVMAARKNAAKLIAESRKKVREADKPAPKQEDRTKEARETATAKTAVLPKPAIGDISKSSEEPRSSEDKTEDPSTSSGRSKKEGGGAKKSGGIHARPANAGGELNALLGGFAGGSESDGQGEETQLAPTAEVGAKEIPELDPHSHIYNEYDEARPGIETVLSKARLFDRMVVKQRLVEIAKFDKDLDLKLKGLSERVVGDLKNEITLAHFHKSVYGGLIG